MYVYQWLQTDKSFLKKIHDVQLRAFFLSFKKYQLNTFFYTLSMDVENVNGENTEKIFKVLCIIKHSYIKHTIINRFIKIFSTTQCI